MLTNCRYEETLREKDIQMLVFLSVLLLKSFPQGEWLASYTSAAKADYIVAEQTSSRRVLLRAPHLLRSHQARLSRSARLAWSTLISGDVVAVKAARSLLQPRILPPRRSPQEDMCCL